LSVLLLLAIVLSVLLLLAIVLSVLLLLTIVLSVLLRFTDSDYHFGIFRPFIMDRIWICLPRIEIPTTIQRKKQLFVESCFKLSFTCEEHAWHFHTRDTRLRPNLWTNCVCYLSPSEWLHPKLNKSWTIYFTIMKWRFTRPQMSIYTGEMIFSTCLRNCINL
jgi:hypothetical protein